MPRFTYLRVDGDRILAFVMAVLVEPEPVPTFQIGVAVPEKERRKGLAKATLSASLLEMQHGLKRNGIARFDVEAVIGLDNIASQRLAGAALSCAPSRIVDSVSGLPAFHYVRRFETPT